MSTVFSAIHVGSYELSMKIYEISKKSGIKTLDHIRHRIDLGTETYATGTISTRHVNELSRLLLEFSSIMKSYGTDYSMAYGTSALRETRNINIILSQLKQRTGIHVDVLSNSEQRFLDYKSIALHTDEFENIIEKSTAIIDIGGGSIQVSLFNKDKLVTTQNLKMGVLRLNQTLQSLSKGRQFYENLISELVDPQLAILSNMYLSDKKYKNLIIIDEYISPILQKLSSEGHPRSYLTREDFDKLIKRFMSLSPENLGKEMNISPEYAGLACISGLLISRLAHSLSTELFWAPGATLCDGMAYEFAENKKILNLKHDFSADIIACGESIAGRYGGSKQRGETLRSIALNIFDKTKKMHGMGKRERLLLELSAILHDCGKMISFINMGDCGYNIIMSTEIIGLSHRERHMVANIVRFNYDRFEYYDDSPACYEGLNRTDYMTIARLTAILRISSGLDRTHKQKFRSVKISFSDNDLIITVDTDLDITVEKGLIGKRADFFEEIYGVRPVIKQKRSF
ncbi:Ppx/GppA phosphatase family protein [Butyrivibrio sp. MC2013]|uniref:Ppx/GppA phosphatase family protein n=1 Tax=Butyrivibrio sp. MC2013 TaxID=1280686 RepID=UPI000400D870|nr:exopolyphosphatase [Butyrivibrio sp. MC2013]